MVAKHAHQRELAGEFGATEVVAPGEVLRRVRRSPGRSSSSPSSPRRTCSAASTSRSTPSAAGRRWRPPCRPPGPAAGWCCPGCPPTPTCRPPGSASSRSSAPTPPRRASRRRGDAARLRDRHRAGRPRRRGPARQVRGQLSAAPLARSPRPRPLRRPSRHGQGGFRPEEQQLMMQRPGFVLEVDDRTPPLVVHEGLGFRLENFPLGTRVVYPPESLPDRARRRGGDPRRAAAPRRRRPAADAAAAGDAADDRLRRPVAAAADDARARHPAADHRAGAHDGRRGRGRRRRADRRERAAPADDAGRAAAHRRRAGLPLVPPPGPARPTTTPRTATTWPTSGSPTRARTSRSTGARPSPTCSSTST